MSKLVDDLLQSQLYLERHKPKTLDALHEALLNARNSIITHIEKTNSLTEYKRLSVLRKKIDDELARAYIGIEDMLKQDMKDAAHLGYDATNNVLNTFALAAGAREAVRFDELPEAAVKRILDMKKPILGQTMKEMVLNLRYSQNKRLREAIAVALIDGDGIETVQRSVRMKEVTQNLFAKILRHEIDTVVRTATMAALHEGRYEAYNQHNDIIIGWRSLATLDKRTSPICIKLDQVFYSKEKYKEINNVPDKPPRHPNCRTILISETRLSESVEGVRPYALHSEKTVKHRDGAKSTKYKVDQAGTVKGTTSFKEWFGNQSAEFQRDYLGSTRYEWYRQGKLDITELYDMTRRKTLTIKELQERLKL